jgi:hypothetical protein
MAVKVLALQSGVTGLTDHRILEGSFIQNAGALQVRGGLMPSPNAAALATVSAMVASVAAFKCVIPNSVSSALGPYVLVSDATVNITFADGEASVARIDRIIARAYDNTNDGSGDTKGDVYYLKGQASGAATAAPSNSIILYEVTVPAGTSAGTGGINFSTATTDRRFYTSTAGGIIPIANNTDMAAISFPYNGMTIYRTDLGALYCYDSVSFRPRSQISVATSGSLSAINNPAQGNVAVARDTSGVYIYNGSSWDLITTAADAKKGIIARGRRTSSTGNVTTTETGFLRIDNIPVVSGRAYRIMTNGINLDTDTSNDVGTVRLRASTSGTATTSSTLLSYFRNTIDNNSQSNIIPLSGMFIAGSTGNLSVLLSVQRQAGSGNLVIFCTATDYLDFWVEDMGVAPSDTGVVI